MIVDIDKKNKNIKHMNILQFKWTLYKLIQKKYYNKILRMMIQLIIKIFMLDYMIQLMF